VHVFRKVPITFSKKYLAFNLHNRKTYRLASDVGVALTVRKWGLNLSSKSELVHGGILSLVSAQILFLGGIDETDNTAYCYCTWSDCVSVTLVHPAKAVRRNEMPFDGDIHAIPSNIVLDNSPDSPRERKIWGSKPSVCSYAAYHQTTLLFFRQMKSSHPMLLLLLLLLLCCFYGYYQSCVVCDTKTIKLSSCRKRQPYVVKCVLTEWVIIDGQITTSFFHGGKHWRQIQSSWRELVLQDVVMTVLEHHHRHHHHQSKHKLRGTKSKPWAYTMMATNHDGHKPWRPHNMSMTANPWRPQTMTATSTMSTRYVNVFDGPSVKVYRVAVTDINCGRHFCGRHWFSRHGLWLSSSFP